MSAEIESRGAVLCRPNGAQSDDLHQSQRLQTRSMVDSGL